MDELSIRRNRSFAVPQRQGVGKTEKTTAAAKTQAVQRNTAVNDTGTLRQTGRSAQAAEARRTLQTGEGVLAEVQEKLKRMGELVREASKEGADHEAIQAELEKLIEDIDRMTGEALTGGRPLFLEGADGKTELPEWLLKAAVMGSVDPERLLASLGLDKSATGSEVLAALLSRPLEGDRTAGYLAALYLGAVIAGSGSGDLDPSAALDGLRQLLEKTASGVPLDKAIQELTGGEYASLADFQQQFAGGTVPGLQTFLIDLLLSDSGGTLMPDTTLLTLLAGQGGMDADLLAALLSMGQVQAELPEGAASGSYAPPLPDAAVWTTPTADGSGTAAAASGTAGATASQALPGQVEVLELDGLQLVGRDLSGVSYDETSGLVTIGGEADMTVLGTRTSGQSLLLTGTGTVTVRDVRLAALTVDSAGARLAIVGRNTAEAVTLHDGAALTLEGRGHLLAGTVHGGVSSLLRLTDGAVTVTPDDNGTPGTVTVPVQLEGAASLAARAADVRDFTGKPLEPFDVVWKALLPGFSAVTGMTLDGRQGRMSLGAPTDLMRLWLAKGDLSSQGFPAHSLTIQGRDEAGRSRTRYAYLRWDRRAGRFQETSMYPNPFTVTGGEQDRDWTYEEETHTLRILTGQVSGISGGAGTDARQEPFSGRIALTDGTGAVKLALGGVVCRVTAGRAFDLGRGNDVTLVLRGGTANVFESGEGCAGISLGEGTSLRVDCPPLGDTETAGTLTATGGPGSTAIGTDTGRDRSGHIMIRGGTATGTEKPGGAGSVTIAGTGASGGSPDLGSARTWARMGIFLQMGADAVILPQYPLSSRTLQLNKLRVSTREYAHAARITIDADRRWVSQLQAAYSALSGQVERDQRSAVRDAASAGSLLSGMRQSLDAGQSQRGQDAGGVGQLLR